MTVIDLSETVEGAETQTASSSSQQATTSSPAQSPPSLLDAEAEGQDERTVSHRRAKEAVLLNRSQTDECGAESEKVLG